MHQAIANSCPWQRKPIIRADDFSSRQEGHLDQVLEAAANHFYVRAVGTATKESASGATQDRTVAPFKWIAVRAPHGHIKPAIGSEDEAVQAAVVAMSEPAQEDSPLVGASVAIGIFERYQVRRISDVEFAVAPGQAHGKYEILCKHFCRLKASRVGHRRQQTDPTAARLLLQLIVQVASR